MIVAAVGLAREARIIAGPDMTVAIGACNPERLREQLSTAAQGARAVISFGLAGALSPMLKPGDCIVASAVHAGPQTFPADRTWAEAARSRLPNAILGEIAGADAIVTSAGQKRRLFAKTGAIAVDTESHIAAAAAAERNIPFLALRAICDGAEMDLPDAAARAIRPDGTTNLAAVLQSVLAKPGQIPLLIRTRHDAEAAFATLRRCRELLGPRLGFAEAA